MLKLIGLIFTGLLGFALALISALLVNIAPVNSGFAWAFAVSCIVGTFMGIGSLLLATREVR